MKPAIAKYFILFLFPACGFFGVGICAMSMDLKGGIVELIEPNDHWRFIRGDQAPSAPADDWRDLDFDDTGWESGPSGFGYGDDDDKTIMDDMQDNFLTVYIRKQFVAPRLPAKQGVELVIDYDDGFIAYLDSKEVMRKHMPSGDVTFETEAEQHEAGTPVVIPLGTVEELLAPGKHVLAIEGHNRNKGSTDFTLNPTLRTTATVTSKTTVSMVPTGAEVKYFVPSDSTWESTWKLGTFSNLQNWKSDTTALGFGKVNPTGAGRTAYNDCKRGTGDSTATNVTSFTMYSGSDSYPSTGTLQDFKTGSTEGMPTVTFAASPGNSCRAANDDRPVLVSGTDLYDVFDGIIDFSTGGHVNYGRSEDWWIDIKFSNLNPSYRYSFEGTAIRNTGSDYSDRVSRFTISGHESATNNSTEGTGIWKEGDVTRFLAWNNDETGNIVRWNEINPGSDGIFEIRAACNADTGADEDPLKAYPFHAFRLQEIGSGENPLEQAMVGRNATLWTRIEFDLDTDRSELKSLALKMRYDDAFVAYLNGTEVSRSNFTGTPAWNSKADGNRDNSLAVKIETFDISSHLSVLQPGTNVLAVQVLNERIQDPNLFFLPELTAERKPNDGSLSYNDAIHLPNGLRIPERMYPLQDASTSPPDGEFIEHQNVGPVDLNLSGVVALSITTRLRSTRSTPSRRQDNSDNLDKLEGETSCLDRKIRV